MDGIVSCLFAPAEGVVVIIMFQAQCGLQVRTEFFRPRRGLVLGMDKVLFRWFLFMVADCFLSSNVLRSGSACSSLPGLVDHSVENDGMGMTHRLLLVSFLLMTLIVVVVLESFDATHT